VFIFFIIYGARPVSHPLGYAADFCPICRKLTTITVSKVRVVPHIFFIPVGKGRALGFEQQCHSCGLKLETSREYFSAFAKSCRRPLEAIISETRPALPEIYADRIELERRLAADSSALTPEEREFLMREVFKIGAVYYSNRDGADGLRLMALALRPLNPEEWEIRACLERYRRQHEMIGARVRTADLMNLIYADRLPRNPNAFDY
jgi:hypothetical protein